MRHYKHTGRRKPTGKIICMLLACAAVIFVLAVLSGSYLKKVAERAASETTDHETTDTSSDVAPLPPVQGPSAYTHTVKGGYLDLTAEDIPAQISTLKTAFGTEAETGLPRMTAVSLRMTDRDGYLVYASQAAETIAHVRPSATVDVAAALTAIRSQGCSPVCLFDISGDFSRTTDEEKMAAALYNCALLRELGALGFDEIILYGIPFTEGGEAALIDHLAIYFPTLSAMPENVSSGIALLPSMYRTDTATPTIAQIAANCDFLAIDIAETVRLSDTAALSNAMTDMLTALRGSFIYYNLRALLPGGDAASTDTQLSALEKAGIENYQFIAAADLSHFAPPPAESGGSDTDPQETETDTVEP